MMPRWIRALGLPGVLGGLLLLLSAWLYWAWLPTQKDQLDTVASTVRQLRHELQQALPQGKGPSNLDASHPGVALSGLSPDRAWQLVWDSLPDENQRLSLLSAVTTSAQKLGVGISSVQYHGAIEPWSARQEQALWRQKMVMPVEGHYADLRMWLAQLLHQPSLSLDALDITRSDTTTDLIKGRVTVSLWWRAAKESR